MRLTDETKRDVVRPAGADQHPDVLIVTNLWPRKGDPSYGIFIRRQVDSVRSLGLKCTVLFVDGSKRWEYLRAARLMLRLNLSSSPPRLVHGHGGETSLIVRWYFRGPVVVSYCGSDLLGTTHADSSLTYGSRVRRFVLRHVSRLLTATITKSLAMEAVLPASTRRRNLVLPNGVNRNVFRPIPRDEARAELGWPLAVPIVLFAGDPHEGRKRHRLATLACAEAERWIGPIRLEVACGMEPDTVPRLMAAADCLLLTSSIEGSPNVVKEAVTCGLPVISTDVGDVRRVLAGVDPSWICAGRPDALAAALVDCLSSRRRSNGWARAKWLGEDAIASKLLDLYGSLAPALRVTGPMRRAEQVRPRDPEGGGF